MTVRLATLADAPIIRDAWNRVQPSIVTWWQGGIADLYDDDSARGVMRRSLRVWIAEDAIGPLAFWLVKTYDIPADLGTGVCDELELMILGPNNWVAQTRGISATQARALRKTTAFDLFEAWFTDAQNRGIDWYWGEGPSTTPAETITLLETTIGFRTRVKTDGWRQWYGRPAEGLSLIAAARLK